MEIRRHILARNTVLNFIGQASPLLVGLIALPLIVQGLGVDRFGVLSLAWVVLGYFSVFDLGLGRATTKYVAEAFARGEADQVSRIVWTAVTVQGVLGLLGSLVLAGITPLLVERILNISPELWTESRSAFYLLALAVTLVLVSSSFSGALEAAQKFGLVNAVRIPANLSSFVLPLVGLALGFQLPGIVFLIVISRFISLLAFMLLAVRVFPTLRKYSARFPLFFQLFSFGGWITVSSTTGPLLLYLDRFLIGSLLSMATVAYYTAPFELITRLWIIPGSLVMTLFPAFSALSGLGQHQQTQELFLRTTKYLLTIITPILFIVVSFAHPFLQVWLGADFAQNSAGILQILAAGALVGILAPVPGAILQGYGRPDLIAKLYLALIPLNFLFVAVLIETMGLPGAALSFTIRTILETGVLFLLALRVAHQPIGLFLSEVSGTAGAVVLASLALAAILWMTDSIPLRGLFVGSIMAAFAVLVWRYVFDGEDRSRLTSLFTAVEWLRIRER